MRTFLTRAPAWAVAAAISIAMIVIALGCGGSSSY